MVLTPDEDDGLRLESLPQKPLYENPAPSLNNPITNRWFAQLGRCLGFEARPAVLHFGGFTAGTIHTQYLKIINISGSAKRLHIINPTTREFKVRVEKRGVLAPGMAETLAIDFEPTEFRYHYDCIRIFTEADNLLVPIHGYSVVNDVQFPTRVDFSSCPLSETQTKVRPIYAALPRDMAMVLAPLACTPSSSPLSYTPCPFSCNVFATCCATCPLNNRSLASAATFQSSLSSRSM